MIVAGMNVMFGSDEVRFNDAEPWMTEALVVRSTVGNRALVTDPRDVTRMVAIHDLMPI